MITMTDRTIRSQVDNSGSSLHLHGVSNENDGSRVGPEFISLHSDPDPAQPGQYPGGPGRMADRAADLLAGIDDRRGTLAGTPAQGTGSRHVPRGRGGVWNVRYRFSENRLRR
jgi:hypothetical protein